MLYHMYQAQADALYPMRTMAQLMHTTMGWHVRPPKTHPMRRVSATLRMLERFTLTHERPEYEIDHVIVDGRAVDVHEEIVTATPFGTLLRFRKDMEKRGPAVLLVAPMSGHFSTLLRYTVRTMLQDHDVYITDWHNARDVALSAGDFGFGDYIDTVVAFLEYLGPGSHVMAVCQPCVQVLAAVAQMAAQDHPCQPLSMTLMGGPIDVRRSPTKVNELAFEKPISWFEKNLIAEVPGRYKGAGRKVYPGFVQLTAFMRMNMQRHLKSHRMLYKHLAEHDWKAAEPIIEFYDEYFSVLDLPAEFYIETVRMVFQEALLAKGELMHLGEKVDPSKIRRTALLTVEGERDDICGLGQTSAAHDLCSNLADAKRHHHIQPGAGHYGLFGGKRWENEIYPVVRAMIAKNAKA